MKREIAKAILADEALVTFDDFLRELSGPHFPSSLGPKPPQCGRWVPRCPSLDELDEQEDQLDWW